MVIKIYIFSQSKAIKSEAKKNQRKRKDVVYRSRRMRVRV